MSVNCVSMVFFSFHCDIKDSNFLDFRAEEQSLPIKSRVGLDEKISISNECKGCHRLFMVSTIFWHVNQSISCKTAYSAREIQAFKDWSKDRKNQRYFEKHKHKEKPRDRRSVKGKAFYKVFEKAFYDACNSFHKFLCSKAYEIVKEKEHYDDIYDKTIDSVFELELLKDSATNSIFSQDCTNTTLDDLIEFGMKNAFEKGLKDNLQKIANSIALKAWKDDKGVKFQDCVHNTRNVWYKKMFAKFYHHASFGNVYEKVFDRWIKNCENEKWFFDAILEASKSKVIEEMIDFMNEEIDKEFWSTKNHQSTWSDWLRNEKQNPYPR